MKTTTQLKTLFSLLTVFLMMQSFLVEGQPGNWFGDLTTTGNTLFVNQPLVDRGAFVSTQPIQATVTKNNAKFLFNTIANIYNPKWSGSTTDTVRIINTKLSGAAYYGQDEYWQRDLETAITAGKYYTFVSGKNSLSNNDMSVLETNYIPIAINSTSQNPVSTNVFSTDNVIITANVNQTLNSGEYLYVRYTTDSWITSQFISMSQTGATTYTSTIPSMSAGSQVSYYILTTINTSPIHGDIDFLTLNLLNNTGLNYNYTVQGAIANSGITDREVTFNEGTNYYNDFSITSIGTYGNTALLTLKGGQLTTWKTSPDNITGANMYYRIYKQGTTPLPVFDTVVLPWRADLATPGHQIWENDTLSKLILYNLTNGNYNIEFYYEAFYTDGINPNKHLDNNGGSNYLLTVEIDDSIYYGTCSIYENYIIIDTTQTVYIDGTNWHNGNLGTFVPTDNFIYKGCQIKTLKTGIFDITETKAYYRYYLQGANPPAFSNLILPWQQDLSYPGTQIWENNSQSVNIINNLPFGNYYFDIYYELIYKIGVIPQPYSKIENNGGNYYKGTFKYSPTVNVDNGILSPEINIYPVPAKDIININIINSGNKMLTLTMKDILGKVVTVETIFSDKLVSLQTQDLLQGVYFLEIQGESFNYKKEVIIY